MGDKVFSDRLKPGKVFFKVVAGFLAFLLFFDIFGSDRLNFLRANAQTFSINTAYSEPGLKGLRINPLLPLQFNFLFDFQDRINLQPSDTARITDYFFAALTIPNEDIWVDLSPDENYMCDGFTGTTRLGRDLLAQDYRLKQVMASLLRPECEPGRTYWRTLYARLARRIGTSNVPVETFNRVCVVPDAATVAQGADGIFIKTSHLKVMLESDYRHDSNRGDVVEEESQNALREVVLPYLEQEVNYGEKFIVMRRIHNALIAALWFKEHFRQSLCQTFIDKKITGRLNSVNAKELSKIYAVYIKTQREGIYNFVRKETDILRKKIVHRRYIAGGFYLPGLEYINTVPAVENNDSVATGLEMVTVDAGKVFAPPQDPVVINSNEEEFLTADGLYDDSRSQSGDTDKTAFLRLFFNPYFPGCGQRNPLRCVCRRAGASCLQLKVEGIRADDFSQFRRNAIMADIKSGKIKFSALGHNKQEQIASEEIKNIRIEISDGSLVFLLQLKAVDDVSLVHLRGITGAAETFKVITCCESNGYNPFEEWASILKAGMLSNGQLHRIDVILRNLLLKYKAVGENLTGKDGKNYDALTGEYIKIQYYVARTMIDLMYRKECSTDKHERDMLDAYFYRLYCVAQGSRHARRMAEYYSSLDSRRREFMDGEKAWGRFMRWATGVTPLYNLAKTEYMPQDVVEAKQWFNRFDNGLYYETDAQLQRGVAEAIQRFEKPQKIREKDNERTIRTARRINFYINLGLSIATLALFIVGNGIKKGIAGAILTIYKMFLAPNGYLSTHFSYGLDRLTMDGSFYGFGETLEMMRTVNQDIGNNGPNGDRGKKDIARFNKLKKTLNLYGDSVKSGTLQRIAFGKRCLFALFKSVSYVAPFLSPLSYRFSSFLFGWRKEKAEPVVLGPEADLYIYWDKLLIARDERYHPSVDSVKILVNGISAQEEKTLREQAELLFAPSPKTQIVFVRSPGGLKHDVRQLVETLAVKAPGKRQIIIDIDSQKVSIDEMTQRHHFPGNSRGVDLSLYQLELLDGVVACEEWEGKNAGGSAVIDSPMVGPVSVSDSIVDHIIWVDEEKAKHGEIVIKKDDFDIDYFDLVNGNIELDKRSKGSVVQVETHNPQRLQYMRRGGVMTIGDSMLGFCKNLFRSINELDTKYEQVNGEKTRPFPLERSWFFRIPLTRLFSGSHMDSYIGWRTRGMLSSQRAYYFDYGEAIENAFKDITAAGLNFKVHMPFTQGAVAVDITEKNLDRQAEELAAKLHGKPLPVFIVQSSRKGHAPVNFSSH